MKKRLSIILCIALALCMIPTTFSFAKTVKPKSVSIAPKSMVLAVGDIVQLTATKKPAKASGKLTWSTSDKSIATVSSKGVVKGISQGTATITVKTTNKKTAKCKVVVKDYATKDELYGSFTEKLKSIFVTKEELSSFATKDDISALPTKEDFSSFATKDDVTAAIGKDTYTKSEIDTKIASIPTGSSCNCTSWSDGTEIECLNKDYLPREFVVRSGVSNNGSFKVTMTLYDITVKKYRFMDYVGDSFMPYRYEVSYSYSLDGVETAKSIAPEYFDEDSGSTTSLEIHSGVGYEAEAVGVPLQDVEKTTSNTTIYSRSDMPSYICMH